MLDLLQKMATYMARYGNRIFEYLLEHIALCFFSVTIAFVIACLIVAATRFLPSLKAPVNAICNAIFAIPTLAMFALLIPLTGIGNDTAIITLVLYNQFILVKNIAQAFDSINAHVIEAAAGMGMSNWRQLIEIKIPLALPVIISGLKTSLIATLAMTTLAANVGAGGLGVLLFQGLAMKKWNQVAWGVVFSLLLGIVTSKVMQQLENRALRKSRGSER
jgi:osmoprotectant transport system permease protein